MKTPFFVFTDDINVFKTATDASGWLEGWIVDENFKAFAADGARLHPRVERVERKRFLGLLTTVFEYVYFDETNNYEPELLRAKLIHELERRKNILPEKVPDDLESRNLDSLIDAAVQVIGYTNNFDK